MKRHVSLFIISLLLLAGCSGAFGNFQLDTQSVEASTLTRSIQYLERNLDGPRYNVTMTVPEEWVGDFETRTTGNRLIFEYVYEGRAEDQVLRAPIFYIDALSNAQYWEQIGSYPGQYVNIINTADTYFLYHLPIDSYYSGLSDAQFDAFAEAVPAVVASLSLERAD